MNVIVGTASRLWLALLGCVALLTGCATTPHADGPKFWEADYADLVIRYNSEQAIYLLKPEMQEGPFYRIFDRQEACNFAADRPGRRDMAVVILGYHRVRALEEQLRREWAQNLAGLNYNRVVFLRDNKGRDINGLRVIQDVQLSRGVRSPVQLGRLAPPVPETAAQ